VRRALIVLCLLLAGCEGFDAVPWRLDRPRVLALRTEVVDEPARSTPRSGETVEVTAFVLPDAPSEWRFTVCLAAAGTREGTPSQAAPFVERAGVGPASFRFEAPPAPAQLRLDGRIRTGDEEEAVLGFIAVSDDASNRHPSLAPAFFIDGAPWPDGGCAVPGAARVAGEVTLAVELGPDAREPVEGGAEELLVSHLTTAGELDRYYSIVPPDEAPRLEVPFRPDEAPDGTDATIHFIVRDDRGGVSWIQRSLCIDPRTGG